MAVARIKQVTTKAAKDRSATFDEKDRLQAKPIRLATAIPGTPPI